MTTAAEILGKFGSGPPPLGTVVLCEGEEWELEVQVPRPTGADWIKRYPVLTLFVTSFGRKMFPEQFSDEVSANGKADVNVTVPEEEGQELDYERILESMAEFFGKKEFIGDYVPAVFGMDTNDKDAMMYLHTFMGPREIINPFMEAAAMIIQYGSDRDDVKEAQKKSPPEVGVEEAAA